MAYRVLIDDNFAYQREEERVTHGMFESAEEAVAACRAIVDLWLAEAFEPGMTGEALWERYTLFGDDPWVQALDPKDAPAGNFSAWGYAQERCEALARGGT